MNYKLWIIGISIIGIFVAIWLIYNELVAPGFCPSYPLLGIPTCILVLLFFILILISQMLKRTKVRSILFFGGTLWGFFTATWFSMNQLLDNAQCPVLFNIPQCYVALMTFGILMVLGIKGGKT